MDLPEILRKHREGLGLSQSDMARRIGVSRATIGYWESGTSYPTQKFWNKISIAYNVSLRHIDPLKDGALHEVDTPCDNFTLTLHILSEVVFQQGMRMSDVSGAGQLAVDERYSNQCFAVSIDDNSMTDEYAFGDVVIVDPGELPIPGDDVVAGKDGQPLMLRRYNSRGLDKNGFPAFDLIPLNPDFVTVTANSEYPATILGVVVEHRKFRKR